MLMIDYELCFKDSVDPDEMSHYVSSLVAQKHLELQVYRSIENTR